MANIWVNENGELITNDAGSPIECDTCPCAGGSGISISYEYSLTDNVSESYRYAAIGSREPLESCYPNLFDSRNTSDSYYNNSSSFSANANWITEDAVEIDIDTNNTTPTTMTGTVNSETASGESSNRYYVSSRVSEVWVDEDSPPTIEGQCDCGGYPEFPESGYYPGEECEYLGICLTTSWPKLWRSYCSYSWDQGEPENKDTYENSCQDGTCEGSSPFVRFKVYVNNDINDFRFSAGIAQSSELVLNSLVRQCLDNSIATYAITHETEPISCTEELENETETLTVTIAKNLTVSGTRYIGTITMTVENNIDYKRVIDNSSASASSITTEIETTRFSSTLTLTLN